MTVECDLKPGERPSGKMGVSELRCTAATATSAPNHNGIGVRSGCHSYN